MPKTKHEKMMKVASERKTRKRFKFFEKLFRSSEALRRRKPGPALPQSD